MTASEQADSGAAEARVFQEPWEAQAFALAVLLSERGIFTWAEWTKTLGATIQAATELQNGDGSAYYQCWLKALEQLVVEDFHFSLCAVGNVETD